MARKKKEVAVNPVSTEPVVIQGSHSIRTEHPDGRIEFVIDYDKLLNDVRETLSQPVTKPKRGRKKSV
jgi:hypothetical protein